MIAVTVRRPVPAPSNATPRQAWRLLAALSLGLMCQAAQAEGSGLRFSGYATLGLTHTTGADGWGFRREIIQSPAGDAAWHADVDSRVGVQLNYTLDPQWEAVAQAVAKRRAPGSRDAENLAWAFLAWRPDSKWTLRAGRTSPDLFLLTDYRDVGFAYPWVRPPVEFYGWMPIWAMDGVDASRTWTEGNANWRAKVFAGRFTSTMGGGRDGDIHTHGTLAGGTLARENDGLTLKLSLARASTTPDDGVTFNQLRSGLRSLQALPVPGMAGEVQALLDAFPDGPFLNYYSALGATWERGPWTLQAEFANVNGNFNAGKRQYAYASGAYRWGPVTLFSSFAKAHSRRPVLPVPQWQAMLTPMIGPELAAQAQMVGTAGAMAYDLSRQEQHTWSLGARWDVTSQAALKLQWDRTEVKAGGPNLWLNPTLDARSPRTLSFSLDLVF